MSTRNSDGRFSSPIKQKPVSTPEEVIAELDGIVREHGNRVNKAAQDLRVATTAYASWVSALEIARKMGAGNPAGSEQTGWEYETETNPENDTDMIINYYDDEVPF